MNRVGKMSGTVTLVVTAICAATVCVAKPAAERMDRSKLLIGAYCMQANAKTDAHIKAIHDCGVDFIIGGLPASDRATLDLFAKHGVGAIVNGVVPGWWGGDGQRAGKMRETNPPEKYAAGAAAFKDHPAIWAIDIGDEPSALDFPYYGDVVRQLNKAIPGMPLYLNLYPNYASVAQNNGKQTINQLGTKTYAEHVDVPNTWTCTAARCRSTTSPTTSTPIWRHPGAPTTSSRRCTTTSSSFPRRAAARSVPSGTSRRSTPATAFPQRARTVCVSRRMPRSVLARRLSPGRAGAEDGGRTT